MVRMQVDPSKRAFLKFAAKVLAVTALVSSGLSRFRISEVHAETVVPFSVRDYWAFTPDQVLALMGGKKFSALESNYAPSWFNLGYFQGWRIRKCKNCPQYLGGGQCKVLSFSVTEGDSCRFFLPRDDLSFDPSDLGSNLWITRYLYPLPNHRQPVNLPYFQEKVAKNA